MGKSTLLGQLQSNLSINLSETRERLKYERNPSILIEEIEALGKGKHVILIDEIQKVPALLDDVQTVIDRKLAQFILTGSSARKLRRNHANLLPGRLISLRMDPITFVEQKPDRIEDVLIYGQLPRTLTEQTTKLKELDLQSYVEIYLEEEVRQEALVRNVGLFHRFLELAALESGRILNYSKISKELGPTVATIAKYFEILQDCLIAEMVEPITDSTSRKKLIRSPKLLFFDMGVRRIAAREGAKLGSQRMGELFEQQIGLEILRSTRMNRDSSLHFWRDPGGVEVDWVVKSKGGALTPIEVKWSEDPDSSSGTHVVTFMNEYKRSKPGLIVARVNRRRKLKSGITIIPWQELLESL